MPVVARIAIIARKIRMGDNDRQMLLAMVTTTATDAMDHNALPHLKVSAKGDSAVVDFTTIATTTAPTTSTTEAMTTATTATMTVATASNAACTSFPAPLLSPPRA